jgi:copper(I)-binding protein
MRQIFLCGAMVLALAGCSKSPTAAPIGVITVGDAWCRAAPAAAPAGGCYLTLTSTTDDRLVSVSTTGADHAEIHSMDMTDGVMRMRQLTDGVALPAGETVALAPGGRHLMLISPKATLSAGSSVSLTLNFAKGAAQTLEVPVRDAATTGDHHG